MLPFAHSHPDHPDDPSRWEPLFTPDCPTLSGGHCHACATLAPDHGHLNKTAHLAASFAADMFPPGPDREAAREWGRIAGLWHDLGKFAPEWQAYLTSKADPHQADVSGKLDHATAGAVHSNSRDRLGSLLAYLIAGHHSGLPDGTPDLFHVRIKKTIPAWGFAAEVSGLPLDLAVPMPPLSRPAAGNDAMAFLLRFLFSSLVDADFIATEAFMQPTRADLRQPWQDDIIPKLRKRLEDHLVVAFAQAPATPVNRARATVRRACAEAAIMAPGIFTLTVPTGGGKTLSSLLFALRHAEAHGLRRVIYVIPYTSIISQNADVFRRAFAPLAAALGREIVLEHHSRFDPGCETETNRLAAENWDSPLIVTTNVRFFESLFANRTSACRRLHRIARSVVIFDEAQALPARLLHPVLRAFTCLVKDLHATTVLCTATQPALDLRPAFPIGIPRDQITPIMPDEDTLFRSLKRVEAENLGEIDDASLVAHIFARASGGALVILNTTAAARELYQSLSGHVPAFHLSARMCPRHIMAVLATVKRLRRRNEPVVLVSTQLVEAGVDVSFPIVYRAECGLDSFAQAAGRCNRNGELEDSPGRTFLFFPTDHPIPETLVDLRAGAAITRSQVLPLHSDRLLSPEAVRAYFEQAIWLAGPRTNQWDSAEIVSGGAPCFPPASKSLEAYQFKSAAQRFRVIDSETHPVVIPWGRKGKALAAEIRALDRCGRPPTRGHFRRAQSFSVALYPHEWLQSQNRLSLHCDATFAILEHPENHYHPRTGLKKPDAPDDPKAFCL